MDIVEMTARELKAAMVAKDLSPVEVTEALAAPDVYVRSKSLDLDLGASARFDCGVATLVCNFGRKFSQTDSVKS